MLRTNFIKGQAANENINLEEPKATIIDSSNATPTAREDVSVATQVDVKEAPHSDITPVNDSLLGLPVKSGPGEIYIAKKGDTYFSISKNYGMTVKDLKTLNELKGELLYQGMELKVTAGGDYADYDKKFHTVEKGETSWAELGKKLTMKTSELKKLNKGMDESSLRPGKKVRIVQ